MKDTMRDFRLADSNFPHRVTLICCLLAAFWLMTLAGCSGRAPVTPTPRPPATILSEPFPESNASQVVRPEEGGQVALRDGATVIIPVDGLSETSVVSLSAADTAPGVPLPRSLLGRAYEFGLDGGSLTGVARIRLPLPSAITLDQYDLAVYLWTGQAWERIQGRLDQQAIEFGTNVPGGIFSVQGEWRLAEATLSLTMPPSESGRATTPVSVNGQYRYAALPSLQYDYVPAHLILKLDTSGGMGQISGDVTKDRTIGEAVLWFKPDPAQAQGVIEFLHLFEVAPGNLDIQPGITQHLYVVLWVDDSPAPTRNLSKAVEYTQILPIRVNGTDVMRPTLAKEPPTNLRWRVLFNGQMMAQRPATAPTLSLTEFLAMGGLGEYRIVLESDINGKPQVISNEVQVMLAVPGTATPTATPVPGPTAVAATLMPQIGTPTPGGQALPTPTRRTPPDAQTATATPIPVITSAPTPTATGTRPAWASVFWADRYSLVTGECTRLNWKLEGVTAVYLNGEGVTGADSRQVCLTETTAFTLSVTTGSTSQDYRLSIAVQAVEQASVQFSASKYTIVTGQCTTLRWETSDVSAVFLDDTGVPGVATKEFCPTATTLYTLRVERAGSSPTLKSLTIKVLAVAQIPMRFWAEQYTLQPSKCTNLHWSVENVEAVYLEKGSGEEGVGGNGVVQVCPAGPTQFFTLRVQASEERTEIRRITLAVLDPAASGLQANDVIIQGIVNNISTLSDADPTIDGNQPGYQVTIDGINPLFTGTANCCQAVVALQVTAVQTGDNMVEVVDWPVNPGQFIEFRGVCSGGVCSMPVTKSFYFKLRSD